VRFRTKVFLSAFAVAALSLLLATIVVSWFAQRQMLQQMEQNLAAEAQLVVRLLRSEPADSPLARYDEEADALGRIVRSRVTFIARDGKVLGDSVASGEALAHLENHLQRPEVIAAMSTGFGMTERWSTTLEREMIYVALPTDHGQVAVVRLALAIDEVKSQANSIVSITLAALLFALIGATGLAWVSSHVLSRRLDELAAVARRYAAGDVSQRAYDAQNDELGSVARALDDSVQSLGRRVRELADERARAEALLSGMVEGVLVASEDGSVRILNEAARHMLKLDPSAIGRSYLEVIRHADLSNQIGRALAGERTAGLELSLTREPGRVFIARAAPVDAAGSSGAVLVLHDITDLRSADRIRRDFVANVSHELRTPLTAIRGYVEALLDAPPDAEETRRFLEIIERHAARMERLVKDLLRLARLDAGQEALERAPCAVQTIFGGVLTELAPTIDGRRQQIRVDIRPGAAFVLGDPAKLHDIFRNLIENASNYSPEGSAIALQAERADRHVLLRVLDEGPGIPEGDRQRVFERFYRVDKARSRATGGTGLGLSIVKHLVDLHGGAVWVENRPDGGAMFTVRLDRAVVAESVLPPARESA
jgi:two-component system phosphate regulon sensor histidine kinase PhoR